MFDASGGYTGKPAALMLFTRMCHVVALLSVSLYRFCRPWVAGIAPGPDGCYSVALSGGYEDDVDLGEALYVLSAFVSFVYPHDCICSSTYTGSGSHETFTIIIQRLTYTTGGRDLKGTKTNPKNVSELDP